eukprot:5275107-Prymnesium_polylepis.1
MGGANALLTWILLTPPYAVEVRPEGEAPICHNPNDGRSTRETGHVDQARRRGESGRMLFSPSRRVYPPTTGLARAPRSPGGGEPPPRAPG